MRELLGDGSLGGALRAARRRRAARLAGGRRGGARRCSRTAGACLTSTGRVALVTGTAHGIGAGDRRGARGARRRRARRRPRHRRRHRRARRSRSSSAAIGRVDILVNNAGGVVGQVGRPLEEVSDEDWRAVVDANLTSTFVCTRAVAPGHEGAPATAGSSTSRRAPGAASASPGIQAYASAKAGQIGFTRQTAHELGPFGITVNCDRARLRALEPDDDRAVGELRRRRAARAARARSRRGGSATPEDIANGVALLRRRGGLVGDRPGDLDRWRPLHLLTTPRYARELAEFLAIPSVSRDPARAGDMRRRGGVGRGAARVRERPRRRDRRASGRARRVARRRRARRRSSSTATTTCSRRATRPSGRRRRSSRASATAASTRRGATDDKGPVLVRSRSREAFSRRRRAAAERALPVRGRGGDRQPAAWPASCASTATSSPPTSSSRPTARCGAPSEPSIAIAAKGLLGARRRGHRAGVRPALGPARRRRARTRCTRSREIVASLHDADGRGRRARLLRRRRGALGRRSRRAAADRVRRGGLPARGRRAGAARRAGLHHARAAVDAADARGQRLARRRRVHRHPAPRDRARHLPAGARPGSGPRLRRDRRARRGARARAGVEVASRQQPGAVPAYAIASRPPGRPSPRRGALRHRLPEQEALLVRIGGTLPAAVAVRADPRR